MRQFLSGLTNQRGDEWGADRLHFARTVLAAVRAAVGADHVVGLRLSCDELAPWAGITPEMAPPIAADLVAAGVDYVVVVRGSIFSVEQTRPDFHQPTGFNVALAAGVAAAVDVPVVLQGSVVDVGQAEWAVGGYDDPASCAAVEMTRAQIADPDLVAKLRAGDPERIRPCTRCNQTCQVRDARNPLVTCVGEPTSGRETEDPDWYAPARAAARCRRRRRRGGRAGGRPASPPSGGTAWCSSSARTRSVGWPPWRDPTRPLVDVARRARSPASASTSALGTDDAARRAAVVQCTGGRAGAREYEVADGAVVARHRRRLRRGTARCPPTATSSCSTRSAVRSAWPSPRSSAVGPCWSPRTTSPATSCRAPATWPRPTSAWPRPACGSSAAACSGGSPPARWSSRDRYSGVDRGRCRAPPLVDCGFRLPTDPLPGAVAQAGDCVAPRTVHEAILEARRVALAL